MKKALIFLMLIASLTLCNCMDTEVSGGNNTLVCMRSDGSSVNITEGIAEQSSLSPDYENLLILSKKYLKRVIRIATNRCGCSHYGWSQMYSARTDP